jgi:DNA-binding CsgD family transcriptional regulator
VKPEKFAIDALGDKRQFLAPLFATPDIGVAVLDKGFRFRAINHVLAETNGFPVKAHIGKTTRQILGPVAGEVEPRLNRAFGTGRIDIFETITKMPTRPRIGHWIQTYIPVKDQRGKTTQVCAIVLEVTEKKRLEELLFGLTGRLLYLHANLSRNVDDLSRSTLHQTVGVSQTIHSLKLVHRCTADIMDVLKAVQPSTSPRSKLVSSDIHFQTRSMRLSLNDNPSIGSLSPRERETMRLLAENKSNKEIGEGLAISVRTVETHRRRIMEKLNVHSVCELVHLAIRNGIVEA